MENFDVKVIFNNKQKILKAKNDENLLSLLAKNGYYIPASCGGKGTCKKCKVKLIEGNVKNATADDDKNILSCKAEICEDITVQVFDYKGSKVASFDNFENLTIDKMQGYGVAFDIGTTTLAFYLINLSIGKEIDSYSCLNPQGVFGGDVISRIEACKNGKLKDLNKLIIDKTNDVIDIFLSKNNILKIDKITVCGNTTMLHLFANVDASPIGEYPFTPAFLEKKEFSGSDLNINADFVTLLPSVASYVGSDITAGILSTDMTKSSNNNLLIDIGTNGEIALFANGKLYCASTAAGPAFEGANITCGIGGVGGAINTAKYDNNLSITTIGGQKPNGICGAGLIDLIAVMIDVNIIDETGAFNDIIKNDKINVKDNKFYITENIFISQKDVREYQLAKSAICSGIKTIVTLAKLNLNDIDKIYIAGGLGFYINVDNAIKTGLIPKELKNKTVVVGNSAGTGTKLCLLSKQNLEKCENIAKECKNIELSTESLFMDEYINNMGFDNI